MVGSEGEDVPFGKNQAKLMPKRKGDGPPRNGDRNVGEALRRVYRETVDETVPDEMLDLLNKLD